MTIEEIDPLANWTLSIDHFYSIIKESLGVLSAGGKYQIQATAIPLDISKDYEWFSRGNINQAFDVALEPVPASDELSAGLQLRTTLAGEYKAFLSRALLLVETAELDDEVIKKIDELEVDIENLSEKESRLVDNLTEKWNNYAASNMIDKGDVAKNAHWLQGQQENYRLKEVRENILLKIALQIGLRDQQYANPDHKSILEAYKRVISPSATMRYPRFEDTAYPKDVKDKFNVVYFAGLDNWDSNLFTNEYMMTPELSLLTITEGVFGKLTSEIEKESIAKEKIITDWNVSASASYGPFKASGSASSVEKIRNDFKTATKMSVSVQSLIAIPFNANTWYSPDIFTNPVLQDNANVFERWLGEKGTLRIIPTHLVICRGLKIKFTNEQEWQYDYEKDFKVGGKASGKIFGVSFGVGAGSNKHVERQKVEKRGHELTFEDGEKNIRIIGFHTVVNPILGGVWDAKISAFREAEEASVRNLRILTEARSR